MGQIHVLSSEIINQIAAGEVVERPAHLVKELVENSLDAGADAVTVEVSEGGRFIRVQDNGHGIQSEDLEKALQRHATSKITKTDDLWDLHTFGFRGEALASAAAVSKMTLTSFEKNEKKASQIQSLFGKISDVKAGPGLQGTEVKIENLFENVPARLKFLKSEAGEVTQIKSVVKALALAHHEVEFKLIVSGDLQFYYAKKKSRLERVKEVLEKAPLYESVAQVGSFNCHAVFASPHEVAKTSKQIWIFVQNRWVQDRALQAAVMDAYRSLLMHGEYPYAVLWLDCPPSEIDVNIHPTKSQVKFENASGAFKAVQSTLRRELEKAPWLGAYANSTTNTPSMLVRESKAQDDSEAKAYSEATNLGFKDSALEQTHFKNKNFSNTGVSGGYKISDYEKLSVDYTPSADTTNFGEALQSKKSEITAAGPWSSLQVIGQAHLTYIVCQKQDRLVFVDQHAAHERVVYESLMQSWRDKNFEVQSFLFPLTVDLSEDKVEALLKNENQIQEMGFEIEQMGPEAIGIKSAPALIKDSGLPVVFEKMAADIIANGGSFAVEKKISDIFATMACHSVVRAGQSLSLNEMTELLKSMDRFALSSFCPHGRPVSVEKTFNELEKLFGRIN